ncbi:HD-GYP domain, c-di-GMP phosphodiesterase class II (or its inactivated variant) [Luteibacter sp. UNC138MFCol5.1]|uniref:HD-GYP domain-containing protein n=1 Tax=Luteibacter sp. UNC138MFCol5.1 TaxID=1502774 RepID=UPI0008C25350|nr:HD-GYP domain-containing protein [Luteibacter sp. UNC138MFCol5.1]SEO84803.1 HD-GYP domain, c-di-GMP phosphodiesterase class II (or its inactivated variant) [Luteibacter sp. UNC138MFCol5.1]
MAYDLVERRVFVTDLEVGMYVSRLDCEWSDTPFPLQGVPITSRDDIERLAKFCKYVFVDLHRRVAPAAVSTVVGAPPRVAGARMGGAPGPAPVNPRLVPSHTYTDTASFDDEVPRAQEAFEGVTRFAERLVDDIQEGRPIDPGAVEQAVRPLVASVLRSGDAFSWVESLRRRDTYTYQHAVGCSTLAAAFGRHMGFAPEAIVSLAAGGLLMDVGKAQLPEEMLNRAGPLNDDEWELARQHVTEGVAILDHSGVDDPDVRDMLLTHHERYDGSGYPEGLAGAAIPLAGRMAAIIDTYHAMSSRRPYRPAVSQHLALRELYAGRDRLFQAELVEQFQACLGVYPTGTLVELNTGEVAIVMVQNQVRRLQPRVAVLTRTDKGPRDEFLIVDLMYQADVVRREILRTLPPGSYGIDPSEYFLP